MKLKYYLYLLITSFIAFTSCGDKDEPGIMLESTVLNVPNEGGTYTIQLPFSAPVYLEPPVHTGPIEVVYNDLYEHITNVDQSLKKNLNKNVLTIEVVRLYSRKSKPFSVYIYDSKGNTVGELKILQEGNSETPIPKLGGVTRNYVRGFKRLSAEAFYKLNLMEQYYHFNKSWNSVNQHIEPTNKNILDVWIHFYQLNQQNLILKDTDSKELDIYQDYCNVFSALYFYYMAVAWGDVPYIDSYSWDADKPVRMTRAPQSTMFKDLKSKLESAMNYLEEKKNESLADENDFFFVSKDVARILLADICMYQGNYTEAEPLLAQIIANGFYTLDASNYSQKETMDDLWNNKGGKELIFATRYEGHNPDWFFDMSPLIPVMTYTDVVLSYAESLYKNGKVAEAQTYLDKVTSAKGITVSNNNVLAGITDARMQLLRYGISNFAFMKRNNLAQEVYGIEAYQSVLPIPIKVINANPDITQNPGY